MNNLTKSQISALAYELGVKKMLPLKDVRVYTDPIMCCLEKISLQKISFISKDKQLDISLVSRHRKYDKKAIDKQLKEYFLGGAK